MSKKPQPVNFNSFTKAELIRTIKKLDKRQTQLLNEVAKLKGQLAGMSAPVEVLRGSAMSQIMREGETGFDLLKRFPWETSK